MVLEIHFRSTAAIKIRKNLNNFPFKWYEAISRLATMCWRKQSLQTVSKRDYTIYTYSNSMVNQLLYCWQMVQRISGA